MLLPVLGGVAIVVAVGVQFFFVFRSRALVVATTIGVCATAWVLARSSLRAFERAMRFRIGLLTGESGAVYRETD